VIIQCGDLFECELGNDVKIMTVGFFRLNILGSCPSSIVDFGFCPVVKPEQLQASLSHPKRPGPLAAGAHVSILHSVSFPRILPRENNEHEFQ